MTTDLGGSFTAPLFISSRLMCAAKVEDAGTLHVHAEHRDSEGRIVYRWLVEDASGAVLGQGDDLSSGCGDPVEYAGIMATLCNFLAACGESYAHKMRHPDSEPENLDLFPPACAEWAYMNSDELNLLASELEPED